MQPYPAAPPLYAVIDYVHLQDRADAGERVYHHRDERKVAQALDRSHVDGRGQGARLFAVKHGRAAYFYDVFGAAHRVSRIRVYDLTDDEPVKEHADSCQVLLDGGLCKSSLETLDLG